jgi:ubiquitin carboxyl-terminal hydrolase 5/13
MPDLLSMEKYKSGGQQPGEELLPDAPAPAAPQANPADVDTLMSMGFPKVRSEKALLTTGGGAEAAMEWLFAHMDDADIDEPYVAPTNKREADAALVEQLVDMGFAKELSVRGLLATGNADVQAALEWMMQHMDDPELEQEPSLEPTSGEMEEDTDLDLGPVQYTCQALACHKGSSVHAGHYIAYARKKVADEEKWVLFNDEKVVDGVAWEEAQKTAHVYFLSRR